MIMCGVVVHVWQLGQFSGGSERERSQHRMEQEKLTNDFKQVLSKFQTISQVAMKHERDTVARDRASSQSGGGGGGGGYGDDQYDEKAALIHEEQREKMQRQGDLIDGNHDQIVEREEAIKEIESTMLEVNEIYRDLNTLVIEQGNALGTVSVCVHLFFNPPLSPRPASSRLRSLPRLPVGHPFLPPQRARPGSIG